MKKQPIEIYELLSENLSHLGGPMGSEYTTDNWRKHFDDVELAKKYAEKDFKNKIKWQKSPSGYCSGDLHFVMYTIKKLKIISKK